MTYAPAALVTAIVAAILLFMVISNQPIKRDGKPLRKPPNYLPFIGNGLLFLQDRRKLLSWFVKCERIFGLETFAIRVPTLPPGVVINDPKNLEFVLKNEDVFSKGEFFKQRSWDLFGKGIINADGEMWKVQRKAGLHFLSTSNIKVLTEVALPKYLDETIAALRESEGKTIDLEAVFHELNTQLMGRMAYDMEMHANDAFTLAFEHASGVTGKRFQNPLWQLTEPLIDRSFRRSIAETKHFGATIVAHAVASKGASESEFETSGSLIASLLDAIDDHDVVADAALNYLSAGRDTTAQALTWTFDQLMRRPDVVRRIRTEDGDTTSSRPYTLAVFYEGLRLFPPIPFEIKQCQQAAILPDGTVLPKDAIVFWSIWAMGRSRLWGDGDVFRPDRWLVDGKFAAKSAFEFPVFNGGTRTCMGKKMAEAVAVMVIARLVDEFDFEGDGAARISKNSLTLPMEGGLPCVVRGR